MIVTIKYDNLLQKSILNTCDSLGIFYYTESTLNEICTSKNVVAAHSMHIRKILIYCVISIGFFFCILCALFLCYGKAHSSLFIALFFPF